MKKSVQVMILALIFLVPTVAYGQLPQCTDTPRVFQNCTYVTPPLDCVAGYTYNITNMTGDMIQNGSLTVHNIELALYRFNFTLTNTNGDYQVTLCDQTFREVYVGGERMSPLLFLLLPFLTSAILLGVAYTLSREEHELARYIIGFFSLVTTLFGVYFATIINVDFFGSANLEEALSIYLYVLVVTIFAIFVYIALYMTVKNLRVINRKKSDELKY